MFWVNANEIQDQNSPLNCVMVAQILQRLSMDFIFFKRIQILKLDMGLYATFVCQACLS